MNQETLKAILAKGILAPSADNLQPWKFVIRAKPVAGAVPFRHRDERDPSAVMTRPPKAGEVIPGLGTGSVISEIASGAAHHCNDEAGSAAEVEFWLDESRLHAFCDTGYLMPYVSAGAVVENLRVAASQYGYRMAVELLPHPEEPLLAASLRFERARLAPDPHGAVLDRRCTNRKFYRPRQKLPPHTYERLKTCLTEEYSGFKIIWMERDHPDYDRLASLVGEADQLRFETARLHQELFAILRRHPREAERENDGLDLRTLEAGPLGRALFGLLKSWRRQRVLNAFGMSYLFNLYARLQMHTARAACLVAAPSSDARDYLRGGALMEKLWHEMTLLGLAVQPMEALPIFIVNYLLNGAPDLKGRQRKTLERLKNEFYSLFRLSDEQGLIMLFRIGLAPPPRVRSRRRFVESFLTYRNETHMKESSRGRS